MVQFIVISVVVLIVVFLIVRRIIKLPSRYERRPMNLSPWNALDQGIDPSLPDQLDL